MPALCGMPHSKGFRLVLGLQHETSGSKPCAGSLSLLSAGSVSRTAKQLMSVAHSPRKEAATQGSRYGLRSSRIGAFLASSCGGVRC